MTSDRSHSDAGDSDAGDRPIISDAWAKDRAIPAENNLAERDLRPLVVARKISFGSQSQAGAKTRETLMTILHTLKKQQANPGIHLKKVLDQLAMNPDQNVYELLFGNSS